MCQSVLICDDTIFMRGTISRAMKEFGFIIAGEAKNGIEAVDRYHETHPTIVTMDIVMPEMSGIEAVRHIIDMDSHACIVMCSAIGQEQLLEESLAAGALGYIVKPFEPHELFAQVHAALAKVQVPTASAL